MALRVLEPSARSSGSGVRVRLAPTSSACSSSVFSCRWCSCSSATGGSCWLFGAWRGGSVCSLTSDTSSRVLWVRQWFDCLYPLGDQYKPVSGGVERRTRSFDGDRYGGELSAVLDAIRRGSDARLLREARHGAASCHVSPLPSGKDQHRPQPSNLCAA